jgi:hypothetical protein
MKNGFLIAWIGLCAACAGMAPRPTADGAPVGRWHGFLLRNGLREPIDVELSATSSDWNGRLSAGDNSVSLEHVRVNSTNVHFELPGEGAFDGTVAGDSMAGSISSGANGSFALQRDDRVPWNPDFLFGP